ncbi:hypothetical protein FRB95_008370 [Tulasnella sp. JGI-2019a]|nr:hypothetical protein FRB95_008370 [Tulasnella sp. JGI-2019a]
MASPRDRYSPFPQAKITQGENRLAPPASPIVTRDVDSPLLAWKHTGEEYSPVSRSPVSRTSVSSSVPGSYPFEFEQESGYNQARQSTDSDFYNRYSDASDALETAINHDAPSHEEGRPNSQEALSALSAILLNAESDENQHYEDHAELDDEEGPRGAFHEDQGDDGIFGEEGIEMRRGGDSDQEHMAEETHVDLDPTMRYSAGVEAGSVASGSGTTSGQNHNNPTPLASASSTMVPPPNAIMGPSYGTTANWHPEASSSRSAAPSRKPSASSSSHNHSTTPTLPLTSTTPSAYHHPGMMSRSNSNATSSAHSSGYASTFPSNATTATTVSAPPSRSNSNVSPGGTSNAKAALSALALSQSSLPYSQPIPRPSKPGQHSTYRSSGVSNGGASPPSLVRRASGSPPLSAVTGGGYGSNAKRRQSGLRSSIVSGDVDWENHATDEDLASDVQHGYSIDSPDSGPSGRARGLSLESNGDQNEGATSIGLGMLGPAISPGPFSTVTSFPGGATRGSSFHSGAASASRPPSSYQDSGRGSGYYHYQHADSSVYTPYTADTSAASSPEIAKRPPVSLHSRPSRSNLQQPQPVMPGLAPSPSGGHSPGPTTRTLGRSPSTGVLTSSSSASVNKSASTSNLVGLRYGNASPGSGTANGGLTRASSYRTAPLYGSDSPEPPVPPLPRRPSAVDQEDDQPAVVMATTANQPVHLHTRVTRSRAPSVTGQNPALPSPQHNLASPPDGAAKASWANHHPPIGSQKGNDWAPSPVREHPEDGEPEHMSASGGDVDESSATDLDSVTGDDDTYNSANSFTSHQNHRQHQYNQQQHPQLHPFETPERHSSYNHRSSTAMGITPPVRPDTQYSAANGGHGGGDNDWDASRRERTRENTAVGYRRAASRAMTETDTSEVDESEFGENDDESGRPSKDDGFGTEERTAAVILAEEGGGLIVNVSGGSISGLELNSGTTHIVMPGTSTPSEVPSFLTTYLPLICETLLALDISSNHLTSLPEALAGCTALEELNVGSNPLKVLPTWLSGLSNLQVLILDATEIVTIPIELSRLNGLRTLSIRRNKLHSIPSWLCLLTQLEWLLVDGNPFLGPWKRLMEPLLNPVPATPAEFTPITPGPFSANSMTSSMVDSLTSTRQGPEMMLTEAEEAALGNGDQTITLLSNPFPRAMAAGTASPSGSIAPYHVYTPSINGFPSNAAPTPDQPGSSATTLGSPFLGGTGFEKPRESQPTYFPQTGYEQRSPAAGSTMPFPDVTITKNRGTYADGYDGNELGVPSPTSTRDHSREPPYSAIPSNLSAEGTTNGKSLKKMQSADELRKRARAGSVSAAMAAATAAVVHGANSMMARNTEPPPPMPSVVMSPPTLASPVPQRALTAHPELTSPDRPPMNRFMSLGMRGSASATNSPLVQNRLALTGSMWEQPTRAMSQVGGDGMRSIHEAEFGQNDPTRPGPPPSRSGRAVQQEPDDVSVQEKGNKKWGFLKKMSMSKMRGNNNTSPETLRGTKGGNKKRPATAAASTMPFNQTGSFQVVRAESVPGQEGSGNIAKFTNMLKPSPSAELLNSAHLSPTGVTARPARRRSFLPLDTPPQLNIPIDKSPLLPVSALEDIAAASPNISSSALSSARQSPLPQEITIHVQEAAVPSATNELYVKALRGVMSYLKDMQDLGGVPLTKESAPNKEPAASPSAVGSANSSPAPERIRRPTVNGWQEGAPGESSATSSPFASLPRPLRNMTSSTSLRGTVAISMITTDSGGSGSNGQEERKTKDDKTKRTHLVREILE